MTKKPHRHGLLAAGLILAGLPMGCASDPLSSQVASQGTVTVRGQAKLTQPDYRLQAVVTPYAGADVEQLRVFVSDGVASEAYVGEAMGIAAPIQIANLRMNTSYTVRLEAYKTISGNLTRIDAANGDCQTNVTTTNNDLIDNVSFRLALANKIFEGTASGTVNVTPGMVTNGNKPVALVTSGPNLMAFGVNQANELVKFNTRTPGSIDATLAITGLQGGENILGLDMRPNGKALYAIGSSSRLYTINKDTGAATQVGAAQFDPLLGGMAYGFDFNPVPDRIRVVTADTNLRLHPDTGAVVDADASAANGVTLDGALAYQTGDANFGTTPSVAAAAYTNPVFPAPAGTTNYGIDSNLDVLVTQGTAQGVTPAVSPNTGKLYTVGALGVNVGDDVHFDINASGDALAVFDQRLYRINLTSGAATYIGAVGGTKLRGFALAI